MINPYRAIRKSFWPAVYILIWIIFLYAFWVYPGHNGDKDIIIFIWISLILGMPIIIGCFESTLSKIHNFYVWWDKKEKEFDNK